jgi:glutamyl-tRNA synthetase
LFTTDELIAAFSLEGISGGNAVFNTDKLDWYNCQHILRLDPDDLIGRLQPLLAEAGWWRDAFRDSERTWIVRVLDLLKPRVRRLTDFVEQGQPFFSDDTLAYDSAAVAAHLATAEGRSHLRALQEALAALQRFDAVTLETTIRSLAEARQVKAGPLIQVARVAVTGRAASPGLFETLELIGRERTLTRMSVAVHLYAS